MKVALIYPYPHATYWCIPPLALLYLATPLLRAGHQVVVYDPLHRKPNVPEMDELFGRRDPDLIGIPIFSPNLGLIQEVLQLLRVRYPAAILVAGGPHPSALPDDVLTQFPQLDFVIRGPAEAALLQLVEAMLGDRDYEDVDGLSFRDGNQHVHQPQGPVVSDVDRIARPARHLLARYYRNGSYYRIGYRGSWDTMLSSRGCPHSCGFCYNPTSRIRFHSTDRVMEELEDACSLGVRNVQLMDQSVASSRRRCVALFDRIRREMPGLTFKIRARVDEVDRELLELMAASGVHAITFGVESGSQRVLDSMGKGVRAEQNLEAVRMAHEAGLEVYIEGVLGYPGERHEDLEFTEQMVRAAPCTGLGLVTLIPSPGTPVYEDLVARGRLSHPWHPDSPDPHALPEPGAPSREELLAFRRRTLLRHYTSPVSAWRYLRHNWRATMTPWQLYKIGEFYAMFVKTRWGERYHFE